MTGQPKSPRGRSASAGFTLLEMILALAIFGMIAALVYSAFFFGHRAVTSGERAADDNQRIRLVEELMGRQIRSAVHYFARHDDEDIPFFLGGPDGMSFVTSAPQSRGGTGLVVTTYRLADRRLVLEERGNFNPGDLYEPPNDARIERAVLLEGFSSFRLEYLAREEDLGWVDRWDARDEDTLPAVVRVTIEGMPFFGGQPWVREIPLFIEAYGWGDNEKEAPEDEDDDDEASDESGTDTGDDPSDDPGDPGDGGDP